MTACYVASLTALEKAVLAGGCTICDARCFVYCLSTLLVLHVLRMQMACSILLHVSALDRVCKRTRCTTDHTTLHVWAQRLHEGVGKVWS